MSSFGRWELRATDFLKAAIFQTHEASCLIYAQEKEGIQYYIHNYVKSAPGS